jgi:hypothetical protein
MRRCALDMGQGRSSEDIQKQVCELKDLLRSAGVCENHDNAVISDRATFKTTALIQFVAERMLILPPPGRVGVVCPNYEIATRFAREYQEMFPSGPAHLRNPLVDSIDDVIRGKWQGWSVPEVYAEEMFMLAPRDLFAIPNFICGIGTLNHPVGLRIKNW